MFKLFIENNQLDTFGTENIELSSQVASISEIDKNLSDYTNSFTVPASAINNAIFKRYYNADIDNSFDARIKVNGSIEVETMPFKIGKFRLEKVSMKNSKPSNYTIQFWGNTISLKDKIKNDELSVLDLSAYNHEYNSDNVQLGLEDSLSGGNVIYSLFAKKQYYYNSQSTDFTITPTLANIAFNGAGANGVRWSDLRPSIKLLPIIEAIESKYNLVFSRDFFGTDEFKKIHVWLNTNSDSKIKGERKRVDFDTGDSTFVDFGTDLVSFVGKGGRFRYLLNIRILPSLGFETVPFRLYIYRKIFVNGSVTNFELIAEYSLEGATSFLYVDFFISIKKRDYFFEIEADSVFGYSSEIVVKQTENTGTIFEPVYVRTDYNSFGTDSLSSTFVVSRNLPKIKTIEFLKGLFQMFKLVVVAQDNGIIYVDKIINYYANGNVQDLTKYIDFTSYDVERGVLLNPINFQFQEPTTLLAKQFNINTTQSYGDEELILEDAEGEQLDGKPFEVKLPFEQFVYERLVDLEDNVQTNIMYVGVFDETITPLNPKLHLHYVENISIGTKTIGFLDDNNTKVELSSTLNIPTHTNGLTNPLESTVFGKEINEWDNTIIENTLYSNNYQDYITAIFNIKKRVFKYTAKDLPLRIRLSLKLNDIVQIKQSFYRIDKFVTNLLTGGTSFELVNSFDSVINLFKASSSIVNTDYLAKTEVISVTNGGNLSFNKIDIGFGITWVTISYIGNLVSFDFLENTTTDERIMSVEITNENTGQKITILLIQNAP